MNKVLGLFSNLVLKTALSGANSASLWHAYQPKLPSQLV